MCSLLSFVHFFHLKAKFQQLFFLIFTFFCMILQMWRSNTRVHRNNKLYREFKNDALSQASFLHLVSKNKKVFLSTQDISVISTNNISHPMYRRALILTSVTSQRYKKNLKLYLHTKAFDG